MGGMALLAFAPAVLTGAAVVGATYGTVRIAGVVGKGAVNYAQERAREKELVVAYCSTELEQLYRSMRESVQMEQEQNQKFLENLNLSMNKFASDLEELQHTEPDVDAWTLSLKASEAEIKDILTSKSIEAQDKAATAAKENITKSIQAIEAAHDTKASLVDWNNQMAYVRQNQKALALEMLRDAQASVKLLESMSKSSGHPLFVEEVNSIVANYNQARGLYDNGMYQAAFSGARKVIRKTALISYEQVQEEVEADFLKVIFEAKIEGLLEEMKCRRYVKFKDMLRGEDSEEICEDLDEFSQGKYQEMLDKITAELNYLLGQESKAISKMELMNGMTRFDSEVEPEARNIIEKAQNVLSGYYEKLHTLEVVADFMEEQNYEMQWAQPVGDDLSQKLVVHFTRKSSGSSISVTLDNDDGAEMISDMAMEVLTFYNNGQKVSEEEKAVLRRHLNDALHEAGIEGEISCQGMVDAASERIEFSSQEEVRELPVKPII